MQLTELQDKIADRALEILDEKYPEKKIGVCMDLFKRGECLANDALILLVGFEEAVQKIVDDSLYWAGAFTGGF